MKVKGKKYSTRLILFLAAAQLFFMKSTNAQEDLSKYSFIKTEFNRLYFSKDSSSFVALCSRINDLKKGSLNRISIVHIGGSHVQGGTWSNTFASCFQEHFKTTGGGYFSFPYKIAKTNGQLYARSFSNGKWKRCRAPGKDSCQPLGMCAINISTNDSANEFGVCLTNSAFCRQANVIRVYHNFNSSFEFWVKGIDAGRIERKDVPENGYSSFRLPHMVDSVTFELRRKDTAKKDFTVYGLSLENDQARGFYLAGLGSNGASSSTFLRCDLLVPQLSSLHADIVVLSLGVNDTQSKGFEKEDYIEHYDSLIAFVKQASPNAFILLTTTTDNYIKRKASNKRTISAREAMFELMEKHNVGVWDLFTIMGGYRSMAKWNKAGLAVRDKVHFTPKGYTILGNLMFEAFLRSYNINQRTDQWPKH